MASGKSQYLERALLDLVLSNVAWSPPATVYIALSTGVWSATATGAAMAEVAGGSYARVAVPADLTNWPAATGVNPASKSNANIVNWPAPTASWGTVKSWYAVDAATGGNVLFGADLVTSKAVVSGDTVSAAAGSLIWQET